MRSSYKSRILFAKQELSALAHAIHAHNIYPRRHTHNLLSQELPAWVCEKASLNREALSLVLNSDRVGRFRRLAGSKFQTDGATKLNEWLTNRFQITFWNFKISLQDRRVQVARSWKVRGECNVEVTVRKSCYVVLAAEFYRQPMQFIILTAL